MIGTCSFERLEWMLSGNLVIFFFYSMETALTSILPNPEYFLGYNPELCLSVNRTHPC